MNLPNKLTIFRVILIPFFIVFLLVPNMPFLPSAEWSKWIALAIFIIASLTDMLDGKIARKYNLITDFGKFMDPLADKLLVCSALIALIELGRIPAQLFFCKVICICSGAKTVTCQIYGICSGADCTLQCFIITGRCQ